MIFEFIIMMIGKDSFLEMKFFGIDGDSACFELSNCTYHEFFFSMMKIKSYASKTVLHLLAQKELFLRPAFMFNILRHGATSFISNILVHFFP